MVENLPIKTHEFNGLTIEGYSRAAVQSYWRIPELKVCFDLGGSPWDFTLPDAEARLLFRCCLQRGAKLFAKSNDSFAISS